MNLGKNIALDHLTLSKLYQESLLLIEKNFFYKSVYVNIQVPVHDICLREISSFIGWETLKYKIKQMDPKWI